jgi:hypothetical protein
MEAEVQTAALSAGGDWIALLDTTGALEVLSLRTAGDSPQQPLLSTRFETAVSCLAFVELALSENGSGGGGEALLVGFTCGIVRLYFLKNPNVGIELLNNKKLSGLFCIKWLNSRGRPITKTAAQPQPQPESKEQQPAASNNPTSFLLVCGAREVQLCELALPPPPPGKPAGSLASVSVKAPLLAVSIYSHHEHDEHSVVLVDSSFKCAIYSLPALTPIAHRVLDMPGIDPTSIQSVVLQQVLLSSDKRIEFQNKLTKPSVHQQRLLSH